MQLIILSIQFVKSFETITHDDLEGRKACVPEVEAKLAVNVDALDCFHASYSTRVKVICIVGLVSGVDRLGGVGLGVIEENIG